MGKKAAKVQKITLKIFQEPGEIMPKQAYKRLHLMNDDLKLLHNKVTPMPIKINEGCGAIVY